MGKNLRFSGDIRFEPILTTQNILKGKNIGTSTIFFLEKYYKKRIRLWIFFMALNGEIFLIWKIKNYRQQKWRLAAVWWF